MYGKSDIGTDIGRVIPNERYYDISVSPCLGLNHNLETVISNGKQRRMEQYSPLFLLGIYEHVQIILTTDIILYTI